MKQIPLSNGLFAKVDDWHFERVAQFSPWHYADGHAVCHVYVEGKRRHLAMHNVVRPPVEGVTVDHIDGDCLNNQESNLRFATRSQQQHNKCRNKNNTSGVPGISWHVRRKSWMATIYLNGKVARCQTFKDFDEAVAARKSWEKEFFGEFACKNPDRLESRSRSLRSLPTSFLNDFIDENKATNRVNGSTASLEEFF